MNIFIIFLDFKRMINYEKAYLFRIKFRLYLQIVALSKEIFLAGPTEFAFIELYPVNWLYISKQIPRF